MKKVYRPVKDLKTKGHAVHETVPGVNSFLNFFRKMAGLARYENRETGASLPTLNDGTDAKKSR